MKNRLLTLLLLLTTTVTPSVLYAQDNSRSQTDLYFTYIGPIIGGGINQLEYTDWFTDSNQQETKKISGFYGSGGVVMHLIVKQVIGELTIQFMHNANESYPVYHMFYTASGKYMFPLSPTFSLYAGLGLYFETPPSNRDYQGSGGGHLPLGFIIKTTRDTRFFTDLFFRYGQLGMGENSRKLSYGLNIGMTFKVGRI